MAKGDYSSSQRTVSSVQGANHAERLAKFRGACRCPQSARSYRPCAVSRRAVAVCATVDAQRCRARLQPYRAREQESVRRALLSWPTRRGVDIGPAPCQPPLGGAAELVIALVVVGPLRGAYDNPLRRLGKPIRAVPLSRGSSQRRE